MEHNINSIKYKNINSYQNEETITIANTNETNSDVKIVNLTFDKNVMFNIVKVCKYLVSNFYANTAKIDKITNSVSIFVDKQNLNTLLETLTSLNLEYSIKE